MSGERGQWTVRNRAARSVCCVLFLREQKCHSYHRPPRRWQCSPLFVAAALLAVTSRNCPRAFDRRTFWEHCVSRSKDTETTVTLTPRLTAFLLLPFSFFLLSVETPHTHHRA